MERLHMLAASDKPIWRLYLKTAASIWWILLHVLPHYLQHVTGIVQVALGKGDDK